MLPWMRSPARVSTLIVRPAASDAHREEHGPERGRTPPILELLPAGAGGHGQPDDGLGAVRRAGLGRAGEVLRPQACLPPGAARLVSHEPFVGGNGPGIAVSGATALIVETTADEE